MEHFDLSNKRIIERLQMLNPKKTVAEAIEFYRKTDTTNLNKESQDV